MCKLKRNYARKRARSRRLSKPNVTFARASMHRVESVTQMSAHLGNLIMAVKTSTRCHLHPISASNLPEHQMPIRDKSRPYRTLQMMTWRSALERSSKRMKIFALRKWNLRTQTSSYASSRRSTSARNKSSAVVARKCLSLSLSWVTSSRAPTWRA